MKFIEIIMKFIYFIFHYYGNKRKLLVNRMKSFAKSNFFQIPKKNEVALDDLKCP